MRNRFWILVLGIASLAVCAAAQQQPQPQPQAQGRDPIADNLFPPELVMANQKAIGLDDAQKAYLRGEISKAQSRFMEIQWQLQDAMESLVGLIKQSSMDETQVLTQLDKVLVAEREMKRAQIGLLVRIKSKLTAEQQTKLQKIRAEAK